MKFEPETLILVFFLGFLIGMSLMGTIAANRRMAKMLFESTGENLEKLRGEIYILEQKKKKVQLEKEIEELQKTN